MPAEARPADPRHAGPRPGSRPPPVLAVEALQVGFARRGADPVRVVDGVGFEIGPREIVSLVGESGSGKSVTSLAVMGLLERGRAVVRGSIRLGGRELVGLPDAEMRALRGAGIAMIFQDPMTALTPVHTIGRQITEALSVHRSLSRRGAWARAVELLGEMGVPDPRRAAERYPHQLSGGLRQRAMIAMALSCDPMLLIADEPTTALDVSVQAQILSLLERLRRDFGSSVLLITHDLGVVGEVADRTLVMYSGTIVERGETGRVLADPRHPYTAGLLASIPPMYGPRPDRLPAIAGSPPAPEARPSGCAYRTRCPWAHEPCAAPPPRVRIEGEREVACVLPGEGRAAAIGAEPAPPPAAAAGGGAVP